MKHRDHNPPHVARRKWVPRRIYDFEQDVFCLHMVTALLALKGDVADFFRRIDIRHSDIPHPRAAINRFSGQHLAEGAHLKQTGQTNVPGDGKPEK